MAGTLLWMGCHDYRGLAGAVVEQMYHISGLTSHHLPTQDEPLSTEIHQGGNRPTPRAADLGYAPRYFGIVLAFDFFRFDGESTLPPQAANASRWAARSGTWNLDEKREKCNSIMTSPM